VCIHPKRDEIDAAILAERPYRSIAAHFGISHLAVYRHKLNHLPDSYTRDSVRRIREDFEDYSNEILSLFERSKTGSLTEAIRAAARVDNLFRLRLKVNALPDDTAAERTVTWEQIRPDLEQALAQIPGALDAVSRMITSKLGLTAQDLEDLDPVLAKEK
ncbi:MAG: hypothetical protein ACKV22_20780, partial [Bryobacteraceae bacterium]